MRQLEKQFNLSSVQSKYTQNIPSLDELPSINYVKLAINELCQHPNLSLLELVQSLEAYEIGVSFHKTKNNNIRGISYHHRCQRLTGTQLGKTYTWPGLINKRNLSYDPEQQTTLEELALSRDVNLVLNEQSSSLIDFIEPSTEKSKMTTISTTKKEKRSRRR